MLGDRPGLALAPGDRHPHLVRRRQGAFHHRPGNVAGEVAGRSPVPVPLLAAHARHLFHHGVQAPQVVAVRDPFGVLLRLDHRGTFAAQGAATVEVQHPVRADLPGPTPW